jgi:hypothetical protein
MTAHDGAPRLTTMKSKNEAYGGRTNDQNPAARRRRWLAQGVAVSYAPSGTSTWKPAARHSPKHSSVVTG